MFHRHVRRWIQTCNAAHERMLNMLVFVMLEDVKGFCSEGLGFTFQSTSFTVFSDHLANFDQSFFLRFVFPSCLNYLKICLAVK